MHNHEAAVTPILTRQNLVMAMLLFVFFSGVYWLTYSGVFLSGDEIALFDGTESLARRGNTQVTYALNERVLRDYAIGPQPDTPLVDSEPMQMLLGVVLFRAAELLPGVGLVHAVWVLNVLVCAAMVSTLYLFARVLGYGVMVSLGGGALLGLGTIIWPYSKVFFREPLVTLLLFAAALCLFAWRRVWGITLGCVAHQGGGAAQPADLCGDCPATRVTAPGMGAVGSPAGAGKRGCSGGIFCYEPRPANRGSSPILRPD